MGPFGNFGLDVAELGLELATWVLGIGIGILLFACCLVRRQAGHDQEQDSPIDILSRSCGGSSPFPLADREMLMHYIVCDRKPPRLQPEYGPWWSHSWRS